MLDEMADAAFRVLSKNRNGFVLMIEGAHIDKQSHLMDTDVFFKLMHAALAGDRE